MIPRVCILHDDEDDDDDTGATDAHDGSLTFRARQSAAIRNETRVSCVTSSRSFTAMTFGLPPGDKDGAAARDNYYFADTCGELGVMRVFGKRDRFSRGDSTESRQRADDRLRGRFG